MISGTAIFDGFLGREASEELLDFALAREADFAPSTVARGERKRVDPADRQSSTFGGEWEELRKHFRNAVLAKSDEILAATGVSDWSPKPMQIDMAAHRDGDFFKTHVDTVTGRERGGEVRMVSAVYYFFRQPKAFSGGELLIRDPRGGAQHAIEPQHDRLVVFPSFLPHEVLPVSVPGNAFADARFSVNCWLNRVRG